MESSANTNITNAGGAPRASIEIDASRRISFGHERQGIPIVHSVGITNTGAVPLPPGILEIALEPACGPVVRIAIPALAPAQVHRVERPDVPLDATALRNVIERDRANLKINYSANGDAIREEILPVEILAMNEFDRSVLPELLAGFVLPNDPAVARVLAAARDLLARDTGNSAIDGYQNKSRARARAIADAIYRSIQKLDISYITVPASFENTGQKLRLPAQMLEHRMGNCIDLSLLIAAALEQAGLHPLICMEKTHAWPAVWLVDDNFSSAVTYDANIIKKLADAGELLIMDSSTVTLRPPQPLTEAESVAHRALERAGNFSYVVDVRAARRAGILPLPLSENSPKIYNNSASTNPANGATAPSDAAARAGAAPDADAPGTRVKPRGRVDVWKERLLDLSLRNRLIHFRPSAARSIDLDCEDLALLESAFTEREKLILEPRVKTTGDDPREQELLKSRGGAQLAREEQERLVRAGRVATKHDEADLVRRVITISREARSEWEETGASTLYLAVGFLKWYEDASSETPRFAPLLLYPVEMERRARNMKYEVRLRNDEIRVNETLLQKLGMEFQMDSRECQAVAADPARFQFIQFLDAFRSAVARIPRFEVLPEARIAFFSFSKYLLWRDLHESTDDLGRNELVRQLASGAPAAAATIPFPDASTLDEIAPPTRSRLVLDADSSQHAAVVAAIQQKSFVLQGPPGTGKSQTITNMIAELLAAGKRVLFVAEKRAALEVVAKRLRNAGLGDFCLELHSHKANKREVVTELARVLDQQILQNTAAAHNAARAESSGAILQQFARRLHERSAAGFSHYEALSRLFSYPSAPELQITFQNVLDTTADLYNSRREAVRALAAAAADCGPVPGHPLAAAAPAEWTPLRAQDWEQSATAWIQAAQELLKCVEQISVLLQLPAALPVAALEPADRCLQMLAAGAPAGAEGLRVRPDRAAAIARLREVCETGVHYQSLRDEILAIASERILDAPLEEWRAAFENYKNSFALFRWLGLRRVRAAMAPLLRAPATDPAQAILILTKAIEARDLRAALRTESALLQPVGGALANGPDSKFQEIISIANFTEQWLGNTGELAKACGAGSAHIPVPDAGAMAPGLAAAFHAAREKYESAAAALITKLSIDTGRAFSNKSNITITDALAFVQIIQGGLPRARAWVPFVRAAAAARALGLAPLEEALRSGKLNITDIEPAFERAFLKQWVQESIERHPELRKFDGREFDRVQLEFQQFDRASIAENGAAIARQLATARPPADHNNTSADSEVGVVRRESVKKTQHLPIRRLLERAPNLIARLKPCFLMSPLSIAQYLPPAREPFDVVIFDEASQIPTHDAIGAIGRGRQVIVVGDTRQLPPTSFFAKDLNNNNSDDEDARASGDDAEGSAPDELAKEVESILEECIASGISQLYLTWHYRSRDERLIAFSNHHYYEKRLQTFPTPALRAPGLGVFLERVNGVFGRGGSRTNRAEADAIVKFVVESLHDPEKRKHSIGIVTFNAEQQTLVLDLLDAARDAHPEMDVYFTDRAPEPVFVKNLENVQGDERDIILFSTAYGPDEKGNVSMNFGPLNRQGGERRLNVAITRAREKLVLFTSLRAEQIDLSRTRSRAARDLKDFLRYAEMGPAALGISNVAPAGAAVRAMEEDLAQRLQKAGYAVERNAGCSNYRLDLAVKDPGDPARFIAGIEFDGENYKSANTTRERERLRPGVLATLGWTVVRVWSSDYFHDPEREWARIFAAVSAAKNHKKEILTPGANAQIAPAPAAAAADSPAPKINNPAAAAPAPSVAPGAPRADSSPPEKYIIYKIAAAGNPGDFNNSAHEARVARLFETIAAVEAPVHTSVLIARACECYQIGRITRAVQSRAELILQKLVAAGKLVQRGEFLWLPSQSPDHYTTIRVSGDDDESYRDITEVPPEERAAAVEMVLRASISLDRDDLANLAADRCGFPRFTEKVKIAMHEAIALLAARGRCRIDGPNATISGSAAR